MCVCIKHRKNIKWLQHTFRYLPLFFPSRIAQQGQEFCPISVFHADSPIQQQDGILSRSSCIGAVEVSSVVVAHRLQQGPQLGVVLS